MSKYIFVGTLKGDADERGFEIDQCRVVTMGPLAEKCKVLKKGTQVFVEGDFDWTVLHATNVRLLGPKPETRCRYALYHPKKGGYYKDNSGSCNGWSDYYYWTSDVKAATLFDSPEEMGTCHGARTDHPEAKAVKVRITYEVENLQGKLLKVEDDLF